MDILKKTCMSAAIALSLAALAIMAQSQEAYASCVKSKVANLRTGPGLNYMKAWKVNQYTPLEKLGQKNSWYRVRSSDGMVYWVFKGLVTDKYKCAVIITDEAQLYSVSELGARQSDISPVFKYIAFKIIESDGDWYKVEGQFKDSGWVQGSSLWIR